MRFASFSINKLPLSFALSNWISPETQMPFLESSTTFLVLNIFSAAFFTALRIL